MPIALIFRQEDERVRRYLKGETLELADMTLPISKDGAWYAWTDIP